MVALEWPLEKSGSLPDLRLPLLLQGCTLGVRMQTIHKPDAGRISVAQAKKQVIEASKRIAFLSVQVRVDEKGTRTDDELIVTTHGIDCDGKSIPEWTEKELHEEDIFSAAFVHHDFLRHCAEAGIVPRLIWRPAVREYTGAAGQDEEYGIAHEEFVKYAEHWDIRVIAGEAEATKQAVSAPAKLTDNNARTWALPPPPRFQGYGRALWVAVKHYWDTGLPHRPKPEQIREYWKTVGHADIFELMDDGGIKFYNANGDPEIADARTFAQTLRRMLDKTADTTRTTRTD